MEEDPVLANLKILIIGKEDLDPVEETLKYIFLLFFNQGWGAGARADRMGIPPPLNSYNKMAKDWNTYSLILAYILYRHTYIRHRVPNTRMDFLIYLVSN